MRPHQYHYLQRVIQYENINKSAKNYIVNVMLRKNTFRTFVINPLIPIYQKEKIALEIGRKIASRNWLLGNLYLALFLLSNNAVYKSSIQTNI